MVCILLTAAQKVVVGQEMELRFSGETSVAVFHVTDFAVGMAVGIAVGKVVAFGGLVCCGVTPHDAAIQMRIIAPRICNKRNVA